MTDPRPTIVIRAEGESLLDLALRALETISGRAATRSEVEEIVRALSDTGDASESRTR